MDDSAVDFVLCNNCNNVVTYRKEDGTAGLHKHQCKPQPKKHSYQPKLSGFTNSTGLPANAKGQILSELMNFVSTDIHPFSVVDGVGFLSFCQTLVDAGAKYGKFDVATELPSRRTISRKLPDLVSKTKEAVRQQLKNCPNIAVTTDGWTDDFRKISYITVTCHYFDSDMKLQSSVLTTEAVDQ